MQTHRAIQHFINAITNYPFSWMNEAVPAFTTVAIYYDPLKLAQEPSPYNKINKDITSLLGYIHFNENTTTIGKTVDIPVCYGGAFGPDIQVVAEHNRLTPEKVIKLHTEGEYLVHMIGFSPGFPYLGGLTEKLATPRRKTPRLKIPAGSVGIAGQQTGVYPLESPGGWQIIGRTPLALFRPHHDSPSLLAAGDRVRFFPISSDEFHVWGGDGHGD